MSNYYCFKGQNATTGSPNTQTGCMSMYGDILAFSTKQKRDKFVAEYYGNNPSVFVRKCNKKTARGYCLGMSMYTFKEYMQYVLQNADEDYDSYFGKGD